jgi:hypothetical protein
MEAAMIKKKPKYFNGILKENRNFNNSQGWLHNFKKKLV